jgi:hypothetical protein
MLQALGTVSVFAKEVEKKFHVCVPLTRNFLEGGGGIKFSLPLPLFYTVPGREFSLLFSILF